MNGVMWSVTRWLERHVCGKETIGHEDCPLMLRWTFFDLTSSRLAKWLPMIFDRKAMIHYFPAGVTDKDPHDHPRSFFTLVLDGSYFDTRWEQTKFEERQSATEQLFPFKKPIKEHVTAPTIRYRPAEYMHIVETGQNEGCWTLVVMGPQSRPWGFLRLSTSKWWPFERYVQKFGGTVRCDTDDGNRDHELHTSDKNYGGSI